MQLSQIDLETILRERERRIAEVSRKDSLAATASADLPLTKKSRQSSVFHLLFLARLRRGGSASNDESSSGGRIHRMSVH